MHESSILGTSSVSLAWYLTSIGFAGTHAGLALAISVAAILNAALLYRGLRADAVLRHSSGWLALLAQVAVANGVMWFVMDRLQRPLTWWLDATGPDRAAWLAVIIGAGAGAYFIMLFVLGLRPAKLGIRPH